jgi:hypothetical protein
MATAAAFAVSAALLTAVLVPLPGGLLVPVVLAAGVVGWWLGAFTYFAVDSRLANRRSRREAEHEYERRTGRPFPGWPEKGRNDEPPDELPAGL